MRRGAHAEVENLVNNSTRLSADLIVIYSLW